MPGTFDVAVLEPIRSDRWTAASIDRRVQEIRQLFE
jgi:hypothetical protein